MLDPASIGLRADSRTDVSGPSHSMMRRRFGGRPASLPLPEEVPTGGVGGLEGLEVASRAVLGFSIDSAMSKAPVVSMSGRFRMFRAGREDDQIPCFGEKARARFAPRARCTSSQRATRPGS